MSTELIPVGEIAPAIENAVRDIITQKTPKNEVRYRQGRGGKQFAYTDPAYVIRTLNEGFAWNWDFEADHEEVVYVTRVGPGGEVHQIPFEVRCRGTLRIRTANGHTITKQQFGCVQIEMRQDGMPVSIGDCFKGAASDAMKKCASLLGIALDLYDSDMAESRQDARSGNARPETQAQPVGGHTGQNGGQSAGPGVWDGPGQCPECHAPAGKRHAGSCRLGQGATPGAFAR